MKMDVKQVLSLTQEHAVDLHLTYTAWVESQYTRDDGRGEGVLVKHHCVI